MTHADDIANLDDTLALVDKIRLGIFQIFNTAVVLTPTQPPEKVKSEVKKCIDGVGKTITELGERKQKIEGLLQLKLPSANENERSFHETYCKMVEQDRWSIEMKARALTSLSRFEKNRQSMFTIPIDHIHRPEIDSDTSEAQLEEMIKIVTKENRLSYKIIRGVGIQENQQIGLKIVKENTFQAIILLEEPQVPKAAKDQSISRVRVFATNEKASMWNQSSYYLHRCITKQAVLAAEHFSAASSFQLSLFIKWLTFYSNVHTTPCSRCHRIFFLHEAEGHPLVPPTHRSFLKGTPIHEQCLKMDR